MNWRLKVIFNLLAVGICIIACNGYEHPDFHWTFDFNDGQSTYEVKSALENVGTFGNGTKMTNSYSRHGLVAYFSGSFSGIVIKNVTSSCFLKPATCRTGFSMSFWINWVMAKEQFLFMSPAISAKHIMAERMVIEIWNGSKAWNIFHGCSQSAGWQHYMITWDKVKMKLFVDGEEKEKADLRDFRNGLIGSAGATFPTRLALGRASTDETVTKLAQVYYDDFKIWERPFNGTEVLEIYNTEVYHSHQPLTEDFSQAIQFTSFVSNTKYTMKVFSVITEQQVTSLEDCYRICSKELNCKSVAFKTGLSRSICRISDEPLSIAAQGENNDGFQYIFVDRGS